MKRQVQKVVTTAAFTTVPLILVVQGTGRILPQRASAFDGDGVPGIENVVNFTDGNSEIDMGGRRMVIRHNRADFIQDFLGLTETQMQEAVQNGTSIATLLEQNGKTKAEFHEYAFTRKVERITQKIANGEISEERGENLLNRMQAMHERWENK